VKIVTNREQRRRRNSLTKASFPQPARFTVDPPYERFGFERTDDGPFDLFGTPLFTMVEPLASVAQQPRRHPLDGSRWPAIL